MRWIWLKNARSKVRFAISEVFSLSHEHELLTKLKKHLHQSCIRLIISRVLDEKREKRVLALLKIKSVEYRLVPTVIEMVRYYCKLDGLIAIENRTLLAWLLHTLFSLCFESRIISPDCLFAFLFKRPIGLTWKLFLWAFWTFFFLGFASVPSNSSSLAVLRPIAHRVHLSVGRLLSV